MLALVEVAGSTLVVNSATIVGFVGTVVAATAPFRSTLPALSDTRESVVGSSSLHPFVPSNKTPARKSVLKSINLFFIV